MTVMLETGRATESAHQVGGCGRMLGQTRTRVGGRAVGYVPYTAPEPPTSPRARVIAFYLPQFHPIPENDRAWGTGFTEWANVTRAVPQVEGQVQPRLPGELGFYDLRVPDVLDRQVELAKRYGLGGFCFHFYWFAGKRLLERPLLDYLDNRDRDLPFCLCWANENWTKRWDGLDSDVVIAQQHSDEDDLAFIKYISKYLEDPRYVRVDGKPLLIVYRPALLPDACKTAATWRRYCKEAGLGDLYLVASTSFESSNPSSMGFDALVEFSPNNSGPTNITKNVVALNEDFTGNVFDWRSVANRSHNYTKPRYPLFRGVNPGWDNTARRLDDANIFLHASPRRYETWLANAVDDAVRGHRSPDHRIVFANAWNEWAEGAYLEPDSRLGYAYLAATRRAVTRSPKVDNQRFRPVVRRRSPLCVVIHAYYPELLGEMLEQLDGCGVPYRLIVTVPEGKEGAVDEVLARHQVTADCRVFENRGRDILPFLRVANELADEGQELVLKLHTKRSPHRVDGAVWRRELIDNLLQEDNAQRILRAFERESLLGMVAPEGHILPLSFYWGSNEASVQYVCRIMGIGEADPQTAVFPAGSMFWARVQALRPLLDLHLDEAFFEPEAGQLDGTMAHAIERCLGQSLRAAKMFLASSKDPLVPADPLLADYAYAEATRPAGCNVVGDDID